MKVLLIDFWSDGNIGDAIMQVELLRQCRCIPTEIHVISCFGANQWQLNVFPESGKFADVSWHPAFFKTYFKLDSSYEDRDQTRIARLILTLLALLLAKACIRLFQITGLKVFLGRHRYLKDMKFDAIVLNGRNYRDFQHPLKDFINNEPLLLHQRLVRLLFPNAKIINAGFSVWGAKGFTRRYIRSAWRDGSINVARETSSESYMRETLKVPVTVKKDLSFPYLSKKAGHHNVGSSTIGFSLTRCANQQRYIYEINEILGYFSQLGRPILLVEQVHLPQEATDDLETHLKFEFSKFSGRSIEEILGAYRECDAVVSTRMHGSIMAMSQGCKVASFAYDKGAKWSILSDEVHDYPLFEPGNSNPKEVIQYLESDRAQRHTKQLMRAISQTRESYVEEFLRNLSS